MAGEGLLFPHNIFISLLGGVGFVLNCFNLVSCFGGQHKLNAVEILQIIKTSFVFVALVTCVPLAANLYDGDNRGFVIFTGFKDIMDVLLIHSKPVAFAVIAIVRYRIATCFGNARVLIPLQWSLVAMALSMIPVLVMAISRLSITVYASNHMDKADAPEKLGKWNTEKIFHFVRLCILDGLPLILGTGFYVKVQAYLCQVRFQQRNRVRHDGSICSGAMPSSQAATGNNQENPTPYPSIDNTHSRMTSISSSHYTGRSSKCSTNPQQSSPIKSSIILQLVSCLVSWSFYIIIEVMYLVDTVPLPNICLLYATLIILAMNPVGDGVFLQQKRERLSALWKKMCCTNRINHFDEIRMNVLRTEIVNQLPTLHEEEEARSTTGPVQILCLQALPNSLLLTQDGKKQRHVLGRQESFSNMSLASVSTLRDEPSSDEMIDGEIARIQAGNTDCEADSREACDIATEHLPLALRSTSRSDCHSLCTVFSRTSGAACPTPSRNRYLYSEASSCSPTLEIRGLLSPSYRSFENGSVCSANFQSSESVASGYSSRRSIASRYSRASSKVSFQKRPSSVLSILPPPSQTSIRTNTSSIKRQSSQDSFFSQVIESPWQDIDDGLSDITEYF